LRPAQLFQADRVVPDLRHVTDAIAVALHRVDAVGYAPLAGRRHRSAGAGMRGAEYAIRGDVLALVVHGERADLVRRVGAWAIQTLHPVRIGLGRVDAGERSGLRRERRARMAILLADAPALAALARIEGLSRSLLHVAHGALLERRRS